MESRILQSWYKCNIVPYWYTTGGQWQRGSPLHGDKETPKSCDTSSRASFYSLKKKINSILSSFTVKAIVRTQLWCWDHQEDIKGNPSWQHISHPPPPYPSAKPGLGKALPLPQYNHQQDISLAAYRDGVKRSSQFFCFSNREYMIREQRSSDFICPDRLFQWQFIDLNY